MITKYINKIKSNISISSKVKSTNRIDGAYKSIYKGKSMNFEDLREYVVGDNVKDIDWKASARSKTLLVKQFIAEKRHNILLVFDTGKKMDGLTIDNENKKDIALFSLGTVSYVALKNSDSIGAIYNNKDEIKYFPFKTSEYQIENILTNYDIDGTYENKEGLNKTLEYITRFIKKRMIIFIVTDMEGIDSVDDNIIKKLQVTSDVVFINVTDASIYGNNVYDIDNASYLASYFSEDKTLFQIEKELHDSINKNNQNKLKKHAIACISISNQKEIPSKIIELLERKKYVSIR